MTVTVINKKTHTPTNHDFYIGRPHELGNPFHITKHFTRTHVIERYKEWLDRVLKDPKSAQARAIKKLREELDYHGTINLVCWCAPQACHGDIIKQHLEENTKP
jgi:hypothetical protein